MFSRRIGILCGEHCRFEIDEPPVFDNVITVGVADRLSAGALLDDVAGDRAGLQDSVLSPENQKEDSLADVLRIGREVLQNILAKEFLRLVSLRSFAVSKLPQTPRPIHDWAQTFAPPPAPDPIVRGCATRFRLFATSGSNRV